MMLPVSLSTGLICLTLFISVLSSQSTYLLPRQRTEELSLNDLDPNLEPYGAVEYYNQLVSNSNYAVAAAEPTQLSILDYIFSPVTSVISLGSTALSVVSWVIVKGGLIFLGMAIVIGFCALTPYCTLTIEKPAFLARENFSALPYLEDLEYYFNEAYHKYLEMQNSL